MAGRRASAARGPRRAGSPRDRRPAGRAGSTARRARRRRTAPRSPRPHDLERSGSRRGSYLAAGKFKGETMKRIVPGSIVVLTVIAVIAIAGGTGYASDHDDGETDLKARALNLSDHFAFKSP